MERMGPSYEQMLSKKSAESEADRMKEKIEEAKEKGREIDYDEAQLLVEIENSTNPRYQPELLTQEAEEKGLLSSHALLSLGPEGSPKALHEEYVGRAREIELMPEDQKKNAMDELKDELYGARLICKFGGGSLWKFEASLGREDDIKETLKDPGKMQRIYLGAAKEALGLGFVVQGIDLMKKIAELRGVETSVVIEEQRDYIENESWELVKRLEEAKKTREDIEERRNAGRALESDDWNEPGGKSVIGLDHAVETLIPRLRSVGLEDLAQEVKKQSLN